MSSDRAALIRDFLATGPFGGWSSLPLAGDASARRYTRLIGPDGQSAILMDADPQAGQDISPFIAIADHLSHIGLCPPAILQSDPGNGLLILSDLGQQHFGQWLQNRADDAATLYQTAVAVLHRVQNHPAPPGLTTITAQTAGEMLAPLFEFYTQDAAPAPEIATIMTCLWADHTGAPTLALRDYHAENLIWRPERDGTDRVGLLDFQDAVLAPPEYDLVSLLRDARRDTSSELRASITAHFCSLTGRDPGMTAAAMAVIGVQRNLRIMGIFARLARQDGKTRYLSLLPRVWAHVKDDLQHPALHDLARPVLRAIPEPAA